eukprot:Hpha_TRINITY_DN11151_c0_g1::TRINITY_DN11151_c0_g1_i2::g.27811::m.27811
MMVRVHNMHSLLTASVVHGTACPSPSPSYESYPEDGLPRYFADMHGAFSVFSEPGGNKVLRQQTAYRPQCTHAGHDKRLFAGGIGDGSWNNYTLSVRALIESAGRNETERKVFVGSHAGAGPMPPEALFDSVAVTGVVLTLAQGGAWTLTE